MELKVVCKEKAPKKYKTEEFYFVCLPILNYFTVVKYMPIGIFPYCTVGVAPDR
jgi:hypothetical protein